MSEKRFVIEIIVCEHLQNENNDVLYIKKTYEMVKGKIDAIECLGRHYKKVENYIKEKISK